MHLRTLLITLLMTSAIFGQEIADAFPVRLTQEEEQQQQMQRQQGKCCNPGEMDRGCCTVPKCCTPPSPNCPPLTPYCDPCDCIIDYYNPLIFNGFDLCVEFLYWKVQQKSSTFVLTPNGIHQPFPPSTIADAIGKYQSAAFDWAPGVRATGSYTFQRDAWKALAQYIYYGTSGSRTINRSTDPTLYLEPTNLEVNISEDGIDQMISKTSLTYQVANLLLSRRYLPGCQILFDFFTGATGAWIHEKWKVTGHDIVGASPPVTTVTQNNWMFKGGGIRVGVDANWHMGSGFGLLNQFSFAGLIGSYNNKRTTHVTPTGTLPELGLVNNPARYTTEDETWVVPNTQFTFGLTWSHRFCSWSTMLLAAFEINTWYDLHQFHQDATGFTPPTTDRIDIRNASNVNLWGINIGWNSSF